MRNVNRNKKSFNRNKDKVIINPSKQRSTPDSIVIDLPFVSEVTTYNSAGAQYYSYYYRINAPFDPDPVGSSKKAGYFEHWAELYSRYRVLSADIEFHAVNAETFPLAIYSAPATTTLTIDAKANVYDLGEGMYATKPMALGNSTGMNRDTRKQRINFGQFVGDQFTVQHDDTYSSAVTTTPSKIIYYYFGFVTNSNMASGVEMHVRVNFRTRFYDRYQDVPNALHRERLFSHSTLVPHSGCEDSADITSECTPLNVNNREIEECRAMLNVALSLLRKPDK